MQLLITFWAGFASCGILIAGGLYILHKIGLMGVSSGHYEGLLAKHEAVTDSKLFKLSEDFNRALGTLATAAAKDTKDNPFYLPEDIQLNKRKGPQREEEYRTSGGAGI